MLTLYRCRLLLWSCHPLRLTDCLRNRAYITTNGDNTVGFHTTNAGYHNNPDDYSFPEGIDCMMAGVITYYVP